MVIQLIHLIVGVSMSVDTSAYGSDQCPQEMDPAIDPASPAPGLPCPGGFSKTKKSHLAGINFTQKDGSKDNISCHEQSSARVIAAKKKYSASQKVQQWPNITESCCSNEKMMINQRISRQPISSSKAMLLGGFNSSTSNLSWGAVEVTHGYNSKGKK